jgi:HK97 family phage prohead protease
MIIKTLEQLKKEFGTRAVTLNTGAAGIRAGLRFTVKEVADETGMVLDFIGSDGGMDRYNEVIDPKAWGDMANFRANPVIPDCHNYDSVARILGKAISVEVKEGKLCDRVEFCGDNPLGLMAYKMAKGGFLNSQSVGFIPYEWQSGKNANEPDRTFTKCELLEISMVVVPANPGATVGLAYQAGALERADLKAAADYLKQFSDDNSNSAGQESAAAAEVHAARLLEMARAFRRVLAK